MSEEQIWRGTASQLTNFWHFLAGIILLVAIPVVAHYTEKDWLYWLTILPLLYVLLMFLKVKFHVYTLTNERLRIRTGILNQTEDEMELYRVKDTMLDLPFLERIFGLGTITLITSDRTHPTMKMRSVSKPRELRDRIRTNVERMRDLKRAREVDFAEDDMEDMG